MEKSMDSYFPSRKDAAQKDKKRKRDDEEDEVVDVLKASMGNLDAEGNDRSNVDVLLESSIQSKKAQVAALMGEILTLEKIEQKRKNKVSKEMSTEKKNESEAKKKSGADQNAQISDVEKGLIDFFGK